MVLSIIIHDPIGILPVHTIVYGIQVNMKLSPIVNRVGASLSHADSQASHACQQ